MGMTRDVVEALTKYKQNLIIRDRGQYSDKSVAECSNLTMKEVAECLDFAIDIMRKYQKIQAIAEKCNLKLLPKEASTFMKDILEVLEDGNDK